MRDEFLELYARNLVRDTRLFEGVAQVLDALERQGLRLGSGHQQACPLHRSAAGRAADLLSAPAA